VATDSQVIEKICLTAYPRQPLLKGQEIQVLSGKTVKFATVLAYRLKLFSAFRVSLSAFSTPPSALGVISFVPVLVGGGVTTTGLG